MASIQVEFPECIDCNGEIGSTCYGYGDWHDDEGESHSSPMFACEVCGKRYLLTKLLLAPVKGTSVEVL